jgi:hypothetical protein
MESLEYRSVGFRAEIYRLLEAVRGYYQQCTISETLQSY